MKKYIISLLLILLVVQVSAVECQEGEVAVDKVDTGGEECIPEPPSPMLELEEYWQGEALDKIYDIMSDYIWI